MPVRPLILSPPIVVRALRDDPVDLLVRAGGGQRWRALRALPALRALFSMTLLWTRRRRLFSVYRYDTYTQRTSAATAKLISSQQIFTEQSISDDSSRPSTNITSTTAFGNLSSDSISDTAWYTTSQMQVVILLNSLILHRILFR